MADEIKNQTQERAFVTWSDESSKQEALKVTEGVLDEYEGVQRASASSGRSFIDIEPNRSVRTAFSRDDYNRFRGEEAVPARQKEAIRMCMAAYDRVGIVRNVIDLMGDFSCQGIMLVHPNKRIEQFYRKWFERCGGKERSERFLNLFYRCGNVVIKRRNAKVNKKIERDLKSKGEIDFVPEEVPVSRREIPWKYDFLNPLSLELIGAELSLFAGKPQFALKISNTLRKQIAAASNSKDVNQKKLISQLPKDLLRAIKDGKNVLPIDPDKLSVHYYKKDDWRMWANPMIYAILDDILMLEKMKLADISALDGAISNIRLWTIGDLEHKILPTKGAINKLRDILASNVGGGTMDLVWGPEIDFKESSTQVYRFLGSEKYQPVLTNIYAGLGVPPTLTGLGGGQGGGFTNNFISLKVLVERLEYGRNALISFWRDEIEIVQKAMGFRFPARVHFDQMVLSDEAAEKNLLIQLVDRDLVSGETVQERFGEIPEIERIRIKREARERQNEFSPQKSGPYHNPERRHDLEKIALQKDLLGPEDVGLIPCGETGDHPFTKPGDRRDNVQIEKKKEEQENKREQREQNKFEQQQKFQPTGRPEDGRPKNARDKEKRKQKVVKPRVAADSDFINMTLWATEAQRVISDILNPALLDHYGKKNLRGLTKEETIQLEDVKLSVLANLEPYSSITPEVVRHILDEKSGVYADMRSFINSLIKDFTDLNKKSPNLEESRQIRASSYALFYQK